jgi:hypothetical protein
MLRNVSKKRKEKSEKGNYFFDDTLREGKDCV